jgi:hypothetical protein
VREKADHKIQNTPKSVDSQEENILGKFTPVGDCRLKCCIGWENSKITLSGRTLRLNALKCPPKRRLIIPISDGTYQNY